MKTLWIRFVSWLLFYANASKDREVYAVKDRLLKRWGKPVGFDVQRIESECYGRGWMGCTANAKCKCGGSGIYEVKLVQLERVEFGGRVFHRPVGRVWPSADHPAKVTIRGYVRHAVDFHAAREAALWLLLIMSPRAWARSLISGRVCGWVWWPMLALQSVVMRLYMRAYYGTRNVWRRVPRLRRCAWCARWFVSTGHAYCERGPECDFPF